MNYTSILLYYLKITSWVIKIKCQSVFYNEINKVGEIISVYKLKI